MKEKVTVRDVAAAAGVSVATVSYVLNGKKKVSEQTRQVVLDVIDQLGYVMDLNARGLTVKNTRLLGVVIPQTEPGSTLMFRNQFYSEILGSIEYRARQNGYHILISATDVTEDYLTLIRERNLAGVIIIGTYQNAFFSKLHSLEIPVVLVDSYCTNDWFHQIRIDDMQGSFMATKYLLDAGHRKIALATGFLKEDGVMQKRLLGYQKALEEAGITYHQDYVMERNVDYESGIHIAQHIVEKKIDVTAVVATADIFAVGLIKGFYECGVKVPDEISVIGFDDLEISRYLTPGLTTVKQYISKKGERAVELLLENIENHDMKKTEEILSVKLVERASVKQLR